MEDIKTRTLSQWSILEDGKFSPAYPTTKSIPGGMYELFWDSHLQSVLLKKQELKTDELYELPSPEINYILEDIDLFFANKKKYEKYKFIHKRGILLYGDPGCGKSGIIQMCTKKLIEKNNGIVINIKGEEDFKYLLDFIQIIKSIESAREFIIILEDIDSLTSGDNIITSNLLNLLDGVKQIENVVYIATTNYPERLEERITNRPSRFDRRYQIGMPNEKIRRAFIINKLEKKDLKNIDIDYLIDRTEGMSLSHLKEIIISIVLMGKDINETIDSIVLLNNSPKIKMGKTVGFSHH